MEGPRWEVPMPEKKKYTLQEASSRTGIRAQELLTAIREGLIRATHLQNTGSYEIPHGDLMHYAKVRGKGAAASSPNLKKILIIDDEVNFANIMRLELERDSRIQAKYATWGRDGIRLAREFQPDLILLDFRLPDINGDQVLAEVREFPDLKEEGFIGYGHPVGGGDRLE